MPIMSELFHGVVRSESWALQKGYEISDTLVNFIQIMWKPLKFAFTHHIPIFHLLTHVT